MRPAPENIPARVTWLVARANTGMKKIESMRPATPRPATASEPNTDTMRL